LSAKAPRAFRQPFELGILSRREPGKIQRRGRQAVI